MAKGQRGLTRPPDGGAPGPLSSDSVSTGSPLARHADTLAIGDERVGTLALAVCMLDRISQQSALGLQGWPGMLRQVSYQRVEECPETPRHLVLPGAEGLDLVQGELDEILPRRRRVHEPYPPVPSVTTPTERCLAAAYRRTSSIRSSACTAVVGSLTAGESALMPTSTIIRMANAGSSRSVRSSPIASAFRSGLPEIAWDPYTLSSAPAPGTWSPTAYTSSITASWLSARCTRLGRSSATSTDPTGEWCTVWTAGLPRSDRAASSAAAACAAFDGYTMSNTARASPSRLCKTFATRRR